MEQLGRPLEIGIVSLASPSLRSHGLRPSILRRSLKNELFIPASEEDARARRVATPEPFYYFNKPILYDFMAPFSPPTSRPQMDFNPQ